jgi:deoxycytidine triphosphate deaminase
MGRIYISGCLTNLDPDRAKDLKRFYSRIADLCRVLGHEPYLPHEHTDPIEHPLIPAPDIYRRDFREILSSDLIIAYVGLPSLGVGMEIEIAKTHDVPVIVLYEDDVRVSRTVLGSPTVAQTVIFPGGNFDRALADLRGALEKAQPGKKPDEYPPDEYDENAKIVARIIASRTPGAPAAVLSGKALELLQRNPVLRPFWTEEKRGQLRPLVLERPPVKVGTDSRTEVRAALDVHIGHEMLILGDPQQSPTRYMGPDAPEGVLAPGEAAIIKSLEYFYMPPFLAGLLVTPVASAMSGMSNISTMIDPVFEGFLLLNIHNPSPWPLSLKYRMVISRVTFLMVAHLGESSLAAPYQWTHGGRMKLSDIVSDRVERMQGGERVYSPELCAALQDWLERITTAANKS